MLIADPSKILNLGDPAPQPPPIGSATEFRKGRKRLLYINAAHTKGSESPTHDAIRQAFAHFKPRCAVIETDTVSKGFHDNFKKLAVEHATNSFANAHEPFYAAHLATQKEIPFVGEAPPDTVIFSGMKEAGYSQKDLLGFNFLRAIPGLLKNGPIADDAWPSHAAETLHKINCRIPASEALTFADFTEWFSRHNTTGQNFAEINIQNFGPSNSPTANYFERLQYAMDPLRERHIVSTITDALHQYDTVLVIYGASHLTKSRPV